MRVGVEIELCAEDVPGFAQQHRIRQRTDAAAATEYLDAHTQPVQRLPEFEADDARAEHRHASGKIGKFEHFLVGDQPVAKCFPRYRIGGRRTRRDDDGRRVDDDSAVDSQRVIVTNRA
jgi:hypothetical protein